MSQRFAWIAFATVLGAAGPALAITKTDRRAKENEAREACLDGNYTGGVAILSKLFVETKDMTYIFNQGRCFEQNQRYQDAIARFREYLRAGRNSPDAAGQAEAERHIADCQEMLAQEHASPATPPPVSASPPATPAASEPAPTPGPAIVGRPTAEPAATASEAGLRTGGVVVAAVGVAALGTGVALNLKANSATEAMYSTNGYTQDSDRKTYTTLAWVGYGVGAACLATGAVLYTVGLRARGGSNVALVPAVGPTFAGAALAGGF
jgi:hypothetical protein